MKRKTKITEEKAIEEAEKVWDKLLAFSGYGFNKSHSAAYGLIAYQCQWLKAKYPLEFWTAGFNFVPHVDKISSFIREIRRTHPYININPPDVNVSGAQFTANPDDDGIYWSLCQIKGIGQNIAAAIMRVRSEGGKFFSLEEFVERCKGQRVTKAHVRTLILSGAFDKIEDVSNVTQRRQLLVRFCEFRKEDITSDPLTEDTALARKEYFWKQEQQRLIGYADIGYLKLLQANKNLSKKHIDLFLTPKKLMRIDLSDVRYGKPAGVCGILVHFKERESKNGLYGILEIEHNAEVIEVLIWADQWRELRPLIDGYLKHLVYFFGVAQYDSFRHQNRMGSDGPNTLLLPL